MSSLENMSTRAALIKLKEHLVKKKKHIGINQMFQWQLL